MTAGSRTIRLARALAALTLAAVSCARAGVQGDNRARSNPGTAAPQAVASATPKMEASPTPGPATAAAGQATLAAPATATSTSQPVALALPTPCPGEVCLVSFPFPFQRPVASPAQDRVDISYRFGSSQGGKRDVHHGVEFLNPHGTAVLAAASGKVVYAGDDLKTKFGLYYNFYGNFVVLEHQIAGLPQPVYSLYAHLSKIDVEVGSRVSSGEKIGEVGATGAATGSHLHFEVRYGENSYAQARNPELWLQPLSSEGGEWVDAPAEALAGALAGKIVDPGGKQVAIPNIVIQRLGVPVEASRSIFYMSSYEEIKLAGLDPWQESFALGDLPPGEYRISFIYRGPQEKVVQVEAGKLTLVRFEIRE